MAERIRPLSFGRYEGLAIPFFQKPDKSSVSMPKVRELPVREQVRMEIFNVERHGLALGFQSNQK
jgi:hypothetical protein